MKLVHQYKGFGDCESKCGVDIFQNLKQSLVILTELPDNEGTSITNMSEHIAQQIKDQYLSDVPVTWVEHYLSGDGEPEDYSLIIYDQKNGKYSGPQWKPVTEEWVDTRIKECE